MKYIFISVITALIVSLIAFIGHNIIMNKTEFFQNDLSNDVTKLVNEYRQTNNLAPVVQNPIVCDLATARSVEISKEFQHTLFLDRFNNEGYRKYLSIAIYGENISKEFKTGEEVVTAWINSPKHKEILDSDFEYGCVICYKYNCSFNTAKLSE